MTETAPDYEPDQILALVAEARADMQSARETNAKIEHQVESLCRLVEGYRLRERRAAALRSVLNGE